MNTPVKHARILVVDDEPDLRTLYELTLLREGYQVDTAENLKQAQALLADHHFEVMITDMRLPDGMGMSLITDIRDSAREERCVVITAYGSAQNAVEALKAGAFDYLTKPVDLKQFRAVVASAMRSGAGLPPSENTAPTASAPLFAAGALGQRALARLVGQSDCMRQVKTRILKVATSMAPVMVTGESGTGKELVAYAIHANSHRAKGPWVAVNCSAIPETLLEAEFFGAKKGAYTGAVQDREGFFHAARGGTLFLDEIGDLPLAMQSKLLRAVQERRIRPLGSNQEEVVDVRVVSATHKNLSNEVKNGRFRQDLFYRLNVIDITIAPLRERTDDLADLCRALLGRIAEESAIPAPVLSTQVLQELSRLPMPGNVRELENLLYRAVALGDGLNLQLNTPVPAQKTTDARKVTSDDDCQLPNTNSPKLPPIDLLTYMDQLERSLLLETLQACDFDRTDAGTRLGLNLRQIRYRMARLHIEMPSSAPAQHATE